MPKLTRHKSMLLKHKRKLTKRKHKLSKHKLSKHKHIHKRSKRSKMYGTGEKYILNLQFKCDVYDLDNINPIENPSDDIINSILGRLNDDITEFFIDNAKEKCRREVGAPCSDVSLENITNNNIDIMAVFGLYGGSDLARESVTKALKDEIAGFQYDNYNLNFGCTLRPM